MTDITRLVELTMTWQKRPKMRRWPRPRLLKALQWPRQRLIAVGLTITVCWAFLALFGPWLIPYDPVQGDSSLAASPPSLAYPFGLDKYGRDVLARVVSGGRYDLFIAVVAVGLAVMAGTVIGAEILSEKLKEYALAARAIGCSDARLVFRHLLPNALGPIITQSTMNLSWAILNAAGLSFLGLGVQPPTPEWGVMISEGSPYIVSGQWWISFLPGAALTLLTTGFILIGDGLNARAER
jgi:peptide/nickel transport system permease protein